LLARQAGNGRVAILHQSYLQEQTERVRFRHESYL
jgi:hypothetical protein